MFTQTQLRAMIKECESTEQHYTKAGDAAEQRAKIALDRDIAFDEFSNSRANMQMAATAQFVERLLQIALKGAKRG